MAYYGLDWTDNASIVAHCESDWADNASLVAHCGPDWADNASLVAHCGPDWADNSGLIIALLTRTAVTCAAATQCNVMIYRVYTPLVKWNYCRTMLS